MKEKWLLYTTYPGTEQWQKYYSDTASGWRVQYEHRTPQGKLFSCVVETLETARAKRDTWLEKNGGQS